jgi:DNA-binding NarL/FixJ family response regulator
MTGEKKVIRIIVVDDHEMIRQSLKLLIELDHDMVVISTAHNGEEAIEQVSKLHPDVVIMDIAMPKMNGLEAALAILKLHENTKVLVVSAYAEDGYIQKALKARVSGYIVKQCSAELLFEAIRKVVQGGTYFCPLITARIKARNFRLPQGGAPSRLWDPREQITPRELQVLQRIAEGLGNKQIAQELSISVKTVEKHRQSIMDKLNIHGVAGLTRYALAEGIIENHR